jgi:hypothetical protein
MFCNYKCISLCISWTDKLLSLFSQENFPWCWLLYIYVTPARMGSQWLVLMESVSSAQIARRGSPTWMSVKTSYTIVRGLEGIPHEIETQRPRFYESRESERGQISSLLSNSKTSD